MKIFRLILVTALLGSGCSDEREELMQELADPSPVRRAGAIKSLAGESDQDAYRLLTRGLEDPSVVVRIAAVQALAAFEGQDTSAALIRAARDKDPEVRQAVVEALAARDDPRCTKALVGMLLRGESHVGVRTRIIKALEERGLSGSTLADELAGARIEAIQEDWDDARPPQRARMVREAGRSIHPDGFAVVRLGLADRDAEVVLAALDVLDGRGGQDVVRQLLALASDRSVQVRQAAVEVLADYGREGLVILEAALRDLSPRVRLRALQVLDRVDANLDTVVLCPLLVDEDRQVALRAAALARTLGLDCDLGYLAEDLATGDTAQGNTAVEVLAAYGGERARALLEQEIRKSPPERRELLAAALARAGDQSAAVERILQTAMDSMLDDFQSWSRPWVTGKLPPRRDRKVEPGEDDRTRLSEEELKKLYEQHGLPPADEGSPRGVGDILKAFPDPGREQEPGSWFVPIQPSDVERCLQILEGLLASEPDERAASVLSRVLDVAHPPLTAGAVKLADRLDREVPVDPGASDRLLDAFEQGSAEQARAVADLLVKRRAPALARALADRLEQLRFARKEMAIRVLGEMGLSGSVDVLIGMLEGYAAAAAAQALARIGDRRAVEPLRQALERAGPAAEMDFLLALARLGDTSIIARVAHKLYDPDPAVRETAVAILGELDDEQARRALEITRFDPDRLVRRKTRALLRAPSTREDEHGGQGQEVER